MDEYNTGMDPEVKKYFRKIMNSFSVGLLWLISFTTAGIFFQLGFVRNEIRWTTFFSIFFFYLACLPYFGIFTGCGRRRFNFCVPTNFAAHFCL